MTNFQSFVLGLVLMSLLWVVWWFVFYDMGATCH